MKLHFELYSKKGTCEIRLSDDSHLHVSIEKNKNVPFESITDLVNNLAGFEQIMYNFFKTVLEDLYACIEENSKQYRKNR